MSTALIPTETIETRILFIRSKKVMLDKNLAELYNVKTKILLQAVKRNKDRFPQDFMFQLNQKEYEMLRSQIVITSKNSSFLLLFHMLLLSKELLCYQAC